MADQVITTTRQDLPEWAQPFGEGLFQSIANWLFPNQRGWLDPEKYGPNKFRWDPGAPIEYPGPLLPEPTDFTDLEKFARGAAIETAKLGAPIRQGVDQFMYDAFSRGDPYQIDTPIDFAQMTQMYNLGGPLAGAARVSALEALMGQPQQAAGQQFMDAMYGPGARNAQTQLYNLLGPQMDLATDASIWSFAGPLSGAARSTALDTLAGPLAGLARSEAYNTLAGGYLNNPLMNAAQSRQFDTIQGRYLSPDSNPWLQANLETGLKQIADIYKYATAPSTAAQFARAGSFGGSANQQTAAMQQFELGRNLSDFTNQFLGENYARERGLQEAAIQAERQAYLQERANQLAALGAERGYTQSALEAERQRQAMSMENALARSLQAALDERSGWRQMVDNQLNRMFQGAEGQLGRGVQMASLIPQLMSSRYQDIDVLRMLGAEGRAMEDLRRQVEYQNALQQFQWPFRVYDILGSGLASFTGGGGVTTQTSTNPNAISPAAQGVGLGMLGLGALSQLGSWLYPQGGAAGDGES